MLRITGIFLFTALILFKPVTQLSWEIWYAVNQDFAAEALCENKEKVELHCNDKCYLAKQLAKAETEKKDQNTPDKQQIPPVQAKEHPYILNNIVQAVYREISVDRHFFIPGNLGREQSFHYSIFHPPQQLS